MLLVIAALGRVQRSNPLGPYWPRHRCLHALVEPIPPPECRIRRLSTAKQQVAHLHELGRRSICLLQSASEFFPRRTLLGHFVVAHAVSLQINILKSCPATPLQCISSTPAILPLEPAIL
jgi:hypothetical protein